MSTQKTDESHVVLNKENSRESGSLKQKKQLRVTWSETKKTAESHLVVNTENS